MGYESYTPSVIVYIIGQGCGIKRAVTVHKHVDRMGEKGKHHSNFYLTGKQL